MGTTGSSVAGGPLSPVTAGSSPTRSSTGSWAGCWSLTPWCTLNMYLPGSSQIWLPVPSQATDTVTTSPSAAKVVTALSRTPHSEPSGAYISTSNLATSVMPESTRA